MSEALLVQEAGAAPVAAPASGARLFWRRLRAQRAATVAAAVVLLLVLAALAAPLLTALAGQDPNTYHPDLVDSAADGARGPAEGAAAAVPAPRAVPADGEPLLEAVGLRREFGRGSGRVTAVDGVSLTLHAGETLGIVGESGSGKTTLGRMLVRLLDPTAGRIRYGGREIGSLSEKALRPVRREIQMVFQDPVASLNPRRSVGESVADPLRAAGETDETRIRDRVGELLERVGLDTGRYERYPHEFSGGQRQRIGIARALAAGPRLIVCDEPVSALDVTTQAQVIALLAELQRELGIGLVFIAHDLAVVRQVSDRVAVMRQGRIVEQGPSTRSTARPGTRTPSSSSRRCPRSTPHAPRHAGRPARSWPQPDPESPHPCVSQQNATGAGKLRRFTPFGGATDNRPSHHP